MDTVTPREKLQQVADLVEEVGAEPLAGWFAAGVRDFLAGRARTLCRALDLRREGHPSPATEAAIRQRDAHLSRAFALVRVPEEASTAARLKALAVALVRFEATTWRWSRRYPDPPDRLDAFQTELWGALKTGATIPTSDRQLRRVILGH